MNQPVLLAVDDDAAQLAAVVRELEDRYGRSYQVVGLPSSKAARERLEEIAITGNKVALAAHALHGGTGSELLEGVRLFDPHARRVLMIEWGEWGQSPVGDVIFEGIARGHFDHYVVRPANPPDEQFHRSISTMLLDWAEAHWAAPYTVHIVGDSWSGRSYELREALTSCALPHNFCLADSAEGRALVAQAGEGVELPIMVFPNGAVLANPSNAEIALAAGGPVSPSAMDYDLVVIGAGPAGLSAAVYGASEGLSTLVLDRGGIGGQATSSSLIRNYLGFPRGISGRQLAREAYDQAWVFGARFAFMHAVTGIERDGDRLVVAVRDNTPVRAAAVVLATGARYRRVGVESLEQLIGAGVYYGGPTSEALGLAGREVFVVGGANSAGQAVLHLARYAKRVTLVVRADSLRAGMSEYLVSQVESTANIEVCLGTEVVGGGGSGRLEQLELRDRTSGVGVTVEADALFLLIGAQPFTDWLPADIERDPPGFVLTGSDVPAQAWALDRAPFDFETSMPGVFAAGDVRHGSVKRVASAVGGGSIAVQFVHQLFAVDGHTPRGRLA